MTTTLPMQPGPHLAAADIVAHTGPRYSRQGEAYFLAGELREPALQGSGLTGWCQGSARLPYRVSVTLSHQGIASSTCNCPVGLHGGCKHVAALLWAWIRAPERFRRVDDLGSLLDSRDAGGLRTVLRMIVRLRPEMEPLIRLPMPADLPNPDPSDYAEQAAAVFGTGSAGWETLPQVLRGVTALQEAAETFATAGHPEAAIALLEALLSAGVGRRDELLVEGAGIDPALAELAACLEVILQGMDSVPRRRSMARLAALTLQSGGVRSPLWLPLIRTAGHETGGNAAQLHSPAAAEEVLHLLTRGDDAEGLRRLTATAPRPAAGVRSGERQRRASTYEQVFDEMLRSLGQGQAATALQLGVQLFRMRPELQLFESLAPRFAGSDEWPEAAGEMLDLLSAQPRVAPAALVHASLLVDDVERAVRLYQERGGGLPGENPQVWILLAQRVQESDADIALRIYLGLAARLAARPGRAHLREACVMLTHARDCCYQSGEDERWPALFAEFLERHEGGALRRELRRVGLLA